MVTEADVQKDIWQTPSGIIGDFLQRHRALDRCSDGEVQVRYWAVYGELRRRLIERDELVKQNATLRAVLAEAIEFAEDVADTSFLESSQIYKHKLAVLKATLGGGE